MAGRLIGSPTIAASTTASSSSAVEVDHNADRFPRRHVGIGAPASLDGTVTVQVDRSSTGSWVDLAQDGSTSLVSVSPNGARLIRNFPFPRLRLLSSTGQTTSREFKVWLQ